VWIVWRECPALAGHGRLVAIVAAASPLLFALLRYGQASAFTLLVWSLAFAALNRSHRFTAGLVLGCLAYKPQLGIVLGVVLVAARQWRIVAGAASTVVAQLGVGWMAVGSAPMRDYASSLWTLMWNPALVQLFPSEVHSARGFFQLLIPSAPVVALCFALTFVALLVVAVRSWASRFPLPVVYGQIVLLTVLASPHLITYDLVLLTLPLLVFADWTAAHPEHRFRPKINALLVLLYFAPFSGQIIARLTNVQVSVVAMALLAWRMYRVCRTEGGELLESA
jgi:hypothetical protein